MTEAEPTRTPDTDVAPADPSPDVADSQAPAHLEERGLDTGLESALDQAEGDLGE